MADVKYVQLEPSAFLTDIDFQMMDAEQRGVYCSIIFYLYCNGGQIELVGNTPKPLLEDKYSILAIISGCHKTGSDWVAVWSKIAPKFEINGNILTHKRVTEELKRVLDFKKAKSEAGKISAQKRWGSNTPITTLSKVKVSKVKTTYKDDSDEVRLTHLLFDLIKKRDPKHRLPDIQKWAEPIDKLIRIDGRSVQEVEQVIYWCQLDDFWQNNILSTQKLRKQFNQLALKTRKQNPGTINTSPAERGADGLTARQREEKRIQEQKEKQRASQ